MDRVVLTSPETMLKQLLFPMNHADMDVPSIGFREFKLPQGSVAVCSARVADYRQ